MEYHILVQKRCQQTIAVADLYLPGLVVNGQTTADLIADSATLTTDAQLRDDALALFDDANNTASLHGLAIHHLVLALPASAEADLDDDIPREADLISLLGPVYAITPQTTDLSVQRGQKLVGALKVIDAYRATLTPPRPPISVTGKTGADLATMLIDQPGLDLATEIQGSKGNETRATLYTHARELDRQGKRVFKRLDAEARTDSALATAMSQITTESANQPGTLGIVSIVQGGTDTLQLLVTYASATFDSTAENTLEWSLTGIDTDFSKSMPVDPSGNALGPFSVGQIVRIRTRVTNGSGTTTGSIRSITLKAP